MRQILLPSEDGKLGYYEVNEPLGFELARKPFNRVAFAAAHIVADPRSVQNPLIDVKIDWDRTIAFRHHLWSLGLGVAEAMDTAQRGMGLNWTGSLELIRRSIDAAKTTSGALVACGAGTDHLDPRSDITLDDVIRAYEEQCEAIEALGGRIILMASRALVRAARTPDDYAVVYGRVLRAVSAPVILHWLGDMFDPNLAGYWGRSNLDEAMDVAISIIEQNANKVDGIKISLLDMSKEVEMRQRLPSQVRMYTGDDFNYPELIAGDSFGESDERKHSHALLGIFDVIAPAASAALNALAEGSLPRFNEILGPTVPLSRHIFQAPTQFYKTGVVFMAYLNGHQDHFIMIGGQQSARSALHFAELFRLADTAGLLRDPDLAVTRMRTILALHGVGRE